MQNLLEKLKIMVLVGFMALPAAMAAADTGAIDQVREFIKEKQARKTIDLKNSDWRTKLPQFPEIRYSDDQTIHWHLKTNLGTMKFKLMPQVAPNHVTNTIYLSELTFYDGLAFHRVISGFMAQGGCPIGTGRGNPGYRFAGEFKPYVRHAKPGLLSMANAGPNTDGSQFFITFVPTPHLDGRHTIFGELVEGGSVLSAFEREGSRNGRPKSKLVIEKAWITTTSR